MKPIKIIQVDTPMFEYRGEKHYVEERRYVDFGKFQDEINRMIEKGATHLFIYSTMNTYPDDKLVTTYPDDTFMDIWIRCKFKKLEDE